MTDKQFVQCMRSFTTADRGTPRQENPGDNGSCGLPRKYSIQTEETTRVRKGGQKPKDLKLRRTPVRFSINRRSL